MDLTGRSDLEVARLGTSLAEEFGLSVKNAGLKDGRYRLGVGWSDEGGCISPTWLNEADALRWIALNDRELRHLAIEREAAGPRP